MSEHLAAGLAAAAGVALDHRFGELPYPRHPVALFGAAMERVETAIYAERRSRGVAYLVIGSAIAAGTGWLLERLLGRTAATTVAVAVCAAGRMLDDEALAVEALLRAGQLDEARERLRSLVGRDTADLNDGEISRAVIESVAENFVDAVIGSLWWGAVVGPVGVLVHRAINTMDAMVGHRSARYERFGWAVARADDAANFLPARVGALAVAAVRPARVEAIARAARRDAPHHPSPNAGVIEAAFAAALGVMLGGTNRYDGTVEHRGTLGDGPPPGIHDIGAAVRLRRRATAAAAAVVGLSSVARQIRSHLAAR